MNIDVKVPMLPDSIHTADIAKLYVSEGLLVYAGDVLFDVETEKVVLEVMADCNGIRTKMTPIRKNIGLKAHAIMKHMRS